MTSSSPGLNRSPKAYARADLAKRLSLDASRQLQSHVRPKAREIQPKGRELWPHRSDESALPPTRSLSEPLPSITTIRSSPDPAVSQVAEATSSKPAIVKWDVEKVAKWLEFGRGFDHLDTESLDEAGSTHDQYRAIQQIQANRNVAKAAKAAHVQGAVLLQLDSAGWAELGVSSALERCRLLADVESVKHLETLPERYDAKYEEVKGVEAVKDRLPPARRSTTRKMLKDQPCDSYQVPKRAEHQMKEGDITGSPHPVSCRCVVRNLIVQDLESQTFEAYIKFEASWEDDDMALADLRHFGLNLDDHIVQSECTSSKFILNSLSGHKKLFTPRITFMNRVDVKNLEEWYSLQDWRRASPKVCWYAHFTGTFSVGMSVPHTSLRMFPLDEQVLSIEVQNGWELKNGKNGNDGKDSEAWRLHGVDLRKNEEKKSILSKSGVSFTMRNQYYQIENDLLFDRDVSSACDSSQGLRFSRLLISICVQRRPWYYLHNIIFPMFLITSALLASYAVPIDQLGARLEAAVTILVALVTFKNWIASKLPDIDHATLIDLYMLLSFTSVFGVIAHQTWAYLSLMKEDEDLGVEFQSGQPESRRLIPKELEFSFYVWVGVHFMILVFILSVVGHRNYHGIKGRRIASEYWGQDD